MTPIARIVPQMFGGPKPPPVDPRPPSPAALDRVTWYAGGIQFHHDYPVALARVQSWLARGISFGQHRSARYYVPPQEFILPGRSLHVIGNGAYHVTAEHAEQIRRVNGKTRRQKSSYPSTGKTPDREFLSTFWRFWNEGDQETALELLRARGRVGGLVFRAPGVPIKTEPVPGWPGMVRFSEGRRIITVFHPDTCAPVTRGNSLPKCLSEMAANRETILTVLAALPVGQQEACWAALLDS